MAQGITLRFQRDDRGVPYVMYIRDLEVTCPICGRQVIQRHYEQTPYHPLTTARFRKLFADAGAGTSLVCEQCGEPMHADSVSRWTLTYGFPHGRGLMQAFGRRASDEPEVCFALSPYRTFDAQMQPEFSVEDDQSVLVTAAFDEEMIRATLGRHLNVKAGWRRALKPHLESELDAVFADELAPGYHALVGPTVEAVESRFAAMRGDEPWISFWLHDELADLLDDGPHAWLPADWMDTLSDGRPAALAACRVAYGHEVLREVLATLPAEVAVERRGAQTVTRFPAEDGSDDEVAIDLGAHLAEALLTGMAPGDRLRLWLDVTVGQLRGVDEA